MIVPIIVGVFTGFLYENSYITNIGDIISDIITFDAAIFSFLLVFFTVLIGLQDTVFFKTMKVYFPNSDIEIFKKIKNILIFCILLFLDCLLFKIVPTLNFKYSESIGVGILFFLLTKMCEGVLFVILHVYETVVKASQLKEPPKREEKI